MRTRTAVKDDTRQHSRLLIGMAVLILASALLAGCGKKDDPEAPDPDSTYPETYPAE